MFDGLEVFGFVYWSRILLIFLWIQKGPLFTETLGRVLEGSSVLDNYIWCIVQRKRWLQLNLFLELHKARRFADSEARVSLFYWVDLRRIKDAWRRIFSLEFWCALREIWKFHFWLEAEIRRVLLSGDNLTSVGSVRKIILARSGDIKVGIESVV